MILGTGIDIIEIDRIKNAVDKWGDNFLDHVFNSEEIDYAKRSKFPEQHFAARFAAKEAVYKAIGDRNIHWKDITILNDEDGKPHCKLNKPNFTKKILISISHTHKHAVANAIITT